jgi:hypothetical protein
MVASGAAHDGTKDKSDWELGEGRWRDGLSHSGGK